ncbi:MAG: hypothetical protein Q9221_004267 [Calogaya cf. arnoldii]
MGGVLQNAVDVFTEEELTSISLTMISANIDAVFRNLALGLGYLSSNAGQSLQYQAHRQIMHAYPDGDAWEKCVTEERIPFISALVKETLRYWTVVPICSPCVSNALAANNDPDFFFSPHSFNPWRYLKRTKPTLHHILEAKEQDDSQIPHFAFGAGARTCLGSDLVYRQLYVIGGPILSPLEYQEGGLSTMKTPRPFGLAFKVRDEQKLDQWLRESEGRNE